jgi:rod shape-determining protein MreD
MMVNRQLKENIWIIASLLIAMVLAIMPQPVWAMYARPQWIFVVLLFWMVMVPQKLGPVFSFLLGLYLDILTGTLLGQHAFVFVIATYSVQRFLRVIQGMPVWQHMLLVGFFSLVNTMIALLFARWQGGAVWHWQMLLPAIMNMLIWPWLYFLCRDVRPTHGYTISN